MSENITHPTELTNFQVNLLAVIANEGECIGLDSKERLADYMGREINHGRLYPNLDVLAEGGLVKKREKVHDERSNVYETTDRGDDLLESYTEWLLKQQRGEDE